MLEDRHLGPSWEHLGAFLAISCDFGALLEHFGGHLGPFWALLGAASRGPRRLPRGTQGAPKPQKKGIQKWIPNLSLFGPILGPFWGPFWAPKLLQNRPQNGTLFWSPRDPLLGPSQDSPKVGHIQGLEAFFSFLHL